MIAPLSLVVAFALGCGGAGGTEVQDQQTRFIASRTYQLRDLKTAEITTGEHKFTVWIMDTDAKRAEGMMFLEDQDVKENQGMIFVFARAQPLSFWMRNTYIPLDIAYIAADGTVLNTYRMKPFDEVSDYSSKGSAKYALELKAGVFEKKGIVAGTKFKIPTTVVAKN